MGAAAEEDQPAPTGKSEDARRAQANAPPVQDTQPILDVAKLVGAKEKKKWNTQNLPSRLGIDAMCAATAAGLVAPVITIVDKCIIENASGKRAMADSVKASATQLLLRPHLFLTSRAFLLIYMLYGGTYTAANTLDTFNSTVRGKPASATTSGLAKFAATSATNMSLSLVKDANFTKMFGTVSARPIPPVTYALFAARDSLTIFASFNLPSVLAPNIPLSESMEKHVSRASIAQFVIPASMQVISTPLHLLGLDLYNRNGGTPFSDRLAKIRTEFFKSTVARICRIIPAFGVGGVVNNGMRKKFMGALEE